MRVLVACEFSGTVRDAFLAAGHDAVSCDLLETDSPGPHIVGDVLDVIRREPWDCMIAFPPCTYLCGSGAAWWSQRQQEQIAAIRFVEQLAHAPVPRVAIENPVGILSRVWRKPDQIIQPWMFDHGEQKKTCLWLRGLPPLMVGLQHTGRDQRIHRLSPSPDRWKQRSKTFQGIADAMAAQWLR